MFNSCEANIKFGEKWNTKNVIDMAGMFASTFNSKNFECIKDWDTSNVENMEQMFWCCKETFNNLNLIKIPPMYEEQIKYVVGIENAKSYYMYLVDKILDLKVLLKNETKIKDVIEIWFLKLARGV
jgi:hypothetical protein